MKIIKYQIQSLIYVKAEITKLTPLPINNISDNYYLIIPTIMTNLPNNVMFIQDILLIPPHSTLSYIPKLVKLGITLSQSTATKLPKGIDIRLLVIDNINNIGSVNNIIRKDSQIKDININHNNTVISDGTIIKVDQQRKELLNTIDDVITKNELSTNTQITNENNNTLKPIIDEYDLPVDNQYSLNDNKNTLNNNDEEENNDEDSEDSEEYDFYNDDESLILDNDEEDGIPIKRGRGRPRKNPINEAQQEFQNLLLNN